MTIPNVTMVWCQKKATCRWCEQPIEVATPMVRVFFWNKGQEDNRRWNVQHCYHPECWIKQGLDYLNKNPYVPKNKRIMLSKEDARKRFLLVRKFHALVQRKDNIKSEYPDNILTEARITNQMVEIMLEMALLGGVPKSWAEKFG